MINDIIIYKLMKLLLAGCLILSSVSCSATFPGPFTSPSSYLTLLYFISTHNHFITFSLVLTPYDSSVLLIASATPLNPSVNRLDWLDINPKSYTQFDYEGLVTARSQFAWLQNPGNGSTIYIYLLNFQTVAMPNFLVTVDQSNTLSAKCATPSYYLSTFYCSSCPLNTMGVYCSITNNQLSLGNTHSVSLSAYSYTSFTIVANQDATLSITTDNGGIGVYFQYNDNIQQTAGLINYLPGDDEVNGFYYFAAGEEYDCSLENGDASVAIGVLNFNSFTVKVSVQYSQDNTSNTMLIVIGVLGGLLFIGIVITIVIIIKRTRDNHRFIHPQTGSEVVPRGMINLAPNEVDYYFPAVTGSQVMHEESGSSLTFNETCSQIQCVICLCSIQAQEQIRVGYCKHIFHANCLSQWFLKQQSCPYCRQDYSRKSTIKLYADLNREVGRKLRGNQIVRGLFRPKLNATLQTLHIDVDDIQECGK